MGYTNYTWSNLKKYLRPGISVLDFGSQNDYSYKSKYEYVSEAYKEMKITYQSIDLNGKNNSLKLDLGAPIDLPQFNIVVDAGTKEHVPSIYNAFLNQHRLSKDLLYCQNPKTGSWPDHGHHYFTKDFYIQLANVCKYKILFLEEYPAMENITDGWEIICILKKTSEYFPDKSDFPKALKQ